LNVNLIKNAYLRYLTKLIVESSL